MAMNSRREFDKTVEYLNRARLLDMRIAAGFERIQQLRSLAQRRTTIYGRERVASGFKPDATLDVVSRIVDAERELDAEIDRLIETKGEIQAAISQVPDERMRGLLELRYLNGRSWEAVADAMHYGERNVYNLHTEALRAIAPIVERARGREMAGTA